MKKVLVILLILAAALSAGAETRYKPREMYMWDTWRAEADGLMHMYYLQIRPDKTEAREDAGDWQGHATSPDLIHWTEHPYALGPGPEGSIDQLQPWTGFALWHEGKMYLYYTMRTYDEQRIGLAISEDGGYTFERYKGNPVIVPDDRWYISDRSVCGCIDCRDMCIVRDGDWWIGYFATRIKGSSPSSTACIGCARSKDLLTWEQLPPVFAPGKYACVEVPDVFYLNGKWYLTMLSSHGYGNRGFYDDPHITAATIYAVSDSPYGPFKELKDSRILITDRGGYSCRSVMFRGKRYEMFTQDVFLSRPYEMKTDAKHRLYLAYPWDIPEARLGEPSDVSALPAPQNICAHGAWNFMEGEWTGGAGRYKGSAKTGWQTAKIITDGSDTMEIEADITIKKGACGIVFRDAKGWDASNSDAGVIFDTAEHTCYITPVLAFDKNQNARDCGIKAGKKFHLHLVRYSNRVDVFIDGRLVNQGICDAPGEARGVNLLIDRGETEVTITSLRK